MLPEPQAVLACALAGLVQDTNYRRPNVYSDLKKHLLESEHSGSNPASTTSRQFSWASYLNYLSLSFLICKMDQLPIQVIGQLK